MAHPFSQAFEAATNQGFRGWFWFPSLEPSKQAPTQSRDVINKKINWCYNNIGAVRAVIDGLALDDVDTGLWPKPATSNVAFNRAVKTLWDQQCGFHRAFSSDGANNFYSAQYLIRREVYLRGDCFGQKLRPGEGAASPQMHFLPGYQCANAETQLDQSKWVDGRMNNSLGRALMYRFLDPEDPAKFRDYSASDVIHFHDPFLIGQRRGMSCLAPVVRKLFSIDDIERAETSGVLLRTRMAYAIERKEADDDSGPSLLPGAVDTQEIEQEDGSKLIVQKIVANDGTEVDVADMPAGRSIKVVESEKTSESGSWIEKLLRDVAYATLRPPEYIFGLAGLSQGTLVRMTQQKVQRVINTVRDFQLIMQLLEEWWPFWLWQNIAAGRFDGVPGGIPEQWWPYVVVRPRDMTVDQGREGRLFDDRFASGKMPAGLYVGMLYGEDEEEHEEAIIRDHYRRRRRNAEIAAELGEPAIPIEEIFRPPAGSTAVAADPASEPPPPDDNPEDQPPNPPPARPAV